MEILYLALGSFIYAIGITHGKSFAEHKKVDIIPNPVKVFKEFKQAKETVKEEKELMSDLENFMKYDGTKQKEG